MNCFRQVEMDTWRNKPRRLDCYGHTGRSEMYSPAEFNSPDYYRRQGLAAKQRAAQCTDPRLKEQFKDVARHWLALAERVEWLAMHYNSNQTDKPR
jgi:hypothetical protein